MKNSKRRVSILLLVISMLYLNALPVFAADSGDAVYRDGVYLVYDHTGILKYDLDGSSKVIELRGGTSGVTYDDWNTFLGGHTYLGAFYNPSYQPASAILGTAYAVQAVPSMQYNWSGQMIIDSSVGYLIYPEHITTLRCDGLVEYCYEYNNSRIWGSGTNRDTNWDISVKPNVGVHFTLGTNGYDQVSPNVQCAQDTYTTLRKRP